MGDSISELVRTLDERIELLTAARDALRRYVALGPLAELAPQPAADPAVNVTKAAAKEVRRPRPSDADAASLTPERTRVLTAIRTTPGLTGRDLRRATRLGPGPLRGHLVGLIRAGLVVASGKTSGKRYAPA